MGFNGNPDHRAILIEGVKSWNKWRDANPDVTPNLRGIELPGRMLQNAELHGSLLHEADLTGANLSQSNLQDANLHKANLSNAVLEGAILKGSNLYGCNFIEADLNNAILRDCNLRGANLSYVNFSNANLRDVAFGPAIMKKVLLDKADLTNATLRGAILFGASIVEAELTDTKLNGANLCEANLSGAILRRTKLISANLNRADLSEANLRGTDLSQASLDSTEFSNCLIRDTIFVNVDLSEALSLEECKHDGQSVIDHRTLQRSKGLPKEFLLGVGLTEDRIRSYLYGTSILIEFTEEGWGDLIPIEKALKATIGEGYDVAKSDDRLAVRLLSPDLLNRTLDAVGAVLSALETESPGEIKLIALQAPGGSQELLTQEQRDLLLIDMSLRLRDQDKPGSLIEETGKGILESSFNPLGPLIMRWIEWFHEKVQKPDEDEERLREIHERFKPAFRALRGVKAIQNKSRSQLPSTAED